LFFLEQCARDSSLLYLLLTLGTVWLGTFLYKFKQTPYLTSAKRELLTDYALPVSVIIMSLIGSILFRQINRTIRKKLICCIYENFEFILLF
jgi:sodium borate transporter 11